MTGDATWRGWDVALLKACSPACVTVLFLLTVARP
jgi:hypothetical protein